MNFPESSRSQLSMINARMEKRESVASAPCDFKTKQFTLESTKNVLANLSEGEKRKTEDRET